MKKRGALKKIKLQAPCYSLPAKVIFVFTDVPLYNSSEFSLKENIGRNSLTFINE